MTYSFMLGRGSWLSLCIHVFLIRMRGCQCMDVVVCEMHNESNYGLKCTRVDSVRVWMITLWKQGDGVKTGIECIYVVVWLFV